MGNFFAVVLTVFLALSAVKSVISLVFDFKRYMARRRILAFLDEVHNETDK